MYYSYFTTLLFSFLLSLTQGTSQFSKFAFRQPKMGTEFNLVLWAADSTLAAKVANDAFLLTDKLNLVFSDYDSTSELSTVHQNAGMKPTPISQEMMDLIRISMRAYVMSEGSFSIAVGPLSRLWRMARKTGIFPDNASIADALALIDFKAIQLDTINGTLYLPHKGMSLDFGGIAKGYTAQKMLDFIHSQGIQHALVDAGGDLCASDGYGQPWKVAVNLPDKTEEMWHSYIPTNKAAIATSGDVFQNVSYQGKRYSHITDPATGYGIQSSRNVTVIAKDGATADWLATACSILPPPKAKKLAKKMKAELFIAERKNGKIKLFKTKGFPLSE